MKPGEAFEKKCYEYLKTYFKNNNTDFYLEGGMDSTKSDIAVIKNGRTEFYIEAKESAAQSGQFVLLPNENTKTFIFSAKNKSAPNEITDIIINYMNSDFNRFYNAGTTGQPININAAIFADWIITHYRNIDVKYVITYNKNYIIFPIRKFDEYFNISADYRMKKSGSSAPAKRDVLAIIQLINESYTTAKFTQAEKKLFVNISEKINKNRFVLGNYTYYLSERNNGIYEVRRLSNTHNMNVIFSIKLIKDQDRNDLDEFKSDL